MQRHRTLVLIATAVVLFAAGLLQEASATLCIKASRPTARIKSRKGACRAAEREVPACLRLLAGHRRLGTLNDPDYNPEYMNATVASPLDGRLLSVVFTDRGVFEYLGVHPGGGATLYHAEPDCTGPAFFPAEPTELVRPTDVWNGILYYAGDPVILRSLGSVESREVLCDGVRTPRGGCCRNVSLAANAGPAQSVDATAFGDAPFHVKRCRARGTGAR